MERRKSRKPVTRGETSSEWFCLIDILNIDSTLKFSF